MPPDSAHLEGAPAGSQFPTTRWTLISRLREGDTGDSRRALDDLCRQYLYPLYCYIRRRGLAHHDAQDALQDFMARVLRLGAFQNAAEAKGRLRGYLSIALQHFLSDWQQRRARRREVSAECFFALDGAQARYERERFTDEDTPDRIFDRKWAQELLGGVLKKLGADYVARGRGALFTALQPVLLQGGTLRGEDIAGIAARAGLSEGALRTALHRLLQDYRDAVIEEVRRTVDEPHEAEEELDHLQAVFGR